MSDDYAGGWYETPEDAPECPDLWHVSRDEPAESCPTCGDEVGV